MEENIKITVSSIPSKPRPFSKLKKEIEKLFAPYMEMEFCCSAYPMRTKGYARNSIPRFYLKMGKEIVWDYPKDFPVKGIDYGLWAGDNGICELVREYIDTPVVELLGKDFDSETKVYRDVSVFYGLTDLFKVADRRLGKRKIVDWSVNMKNYRGYHVLAKRLYPTEFKPKLKNAS
jgi:hypothetical protein